jgi:hypothetical protein
LNGFDIIPIVGQVIGAAASGVALTVWRAPSDPGVGVEDRGSSSSLAMFTAILRASSLLSNLAAEDNAIKNGGVGKMVNRPPPFKFSHLSPGDDGSR